MEKAKVYFSKNITPENVIRLYEALGKALLSTLLSMVREVLFGVGLALLLPRFFGLDGVLYSMPVADVLTFVLSAAALAVTYRRLSRPQAA